MMPGVFAGGAMGADAPPAVVYTALNPSDKSANISLSGADLTAIASGAPGGFVRSVHAITGKRYFEARFNIVPAIGAVIAAGVATSTATNTGSLAYSTADGWAFWGPGVGARHNGSTDIALASNEFDVFGFAVDEPGGKMWIRKNGAWIQGDPAAGTSPIWTDLSGALYAAACPWGDTSSITMRFNPSSFRDAAPSGFSPIAA